MLGFFKAPFLGLLLSYRIFAGSKPTIQSYVEYYCHI